MDTQSNALPSNTNPSVKARSIFHGVNILRQIHDSILVNYRIHGVLKRGCNSQIGAPVIPNVPVLVIDHKATRDSDSLKREDHVVNTQEFAPILSCSEPKLHVLLPSVRKVAFRSNFLTSPSTVPIVAFRLAVKMMQWARLPSHLSRLGIVIERFLKKFQRRHDAFCRVGCFHELHSITRCP